MKASAIMQRMDLRRHRARVLFAEVRRIIHPYLRPEEDIGRAFREIEDLFTREGVEVMTDYTRAEIGLPPRGPDGWTTEEILTLEKVRLERMLAPQPHFIPNPTAKPG